MSAEIIEFMPRPRPKRPPAGFPGLALRSTARPDDLVVAHADTSPCEFVGASHEGIRVEDGQSSN